MTSLAVAILSNEPITGVGARAYLRSQPELRVLDADELGLADVLLVVVDDLGEDVLALMEQAANQAPAHRLRMVVVTNTIRERQLHGRLRHARRRPIDIRSVACPRRSRWSAPVSAGSGGSRRAATRSRSPPTCGS